MRLGSHGGTGLKQGGITPLSIVSSPVRHLAFSAIRQTDIGIRRLCLSHLYFLNRGPKAQEQQYWQFRSAKKKLQSASFNWKGESSQYEKIKSSADNPKIFNKSKPVCENVMKERGICASCAVAYQTMVSA